MSEVLSLMKMKGQHCETCGGSIIVYPFLDREDNRLKVSHLECVNCGQRFVALTECYYPFVERYGEKYEC